MDSGEGKNKLARNYTLWYSGVTTKNQDNSGNFMYKHLGLP